MFPFVLLQLRQDTNSFLRFANAGVNIVTDICTAVLPLPVLNTMRLPQRQKYILMAVFGLGGITCLISILRLQSLYVISKSNDVTWDNPLAAIWSSLEVNIGIMSAVSSNKYHTCLVHSLIST